MTAWRVVVAALALVFLSCARPEPSGVSDVPGEGQVNGSLPETDFTFGASRVRMTVDSAGSDASLNVMVCEYDCPAYGTEISPGSRALSLSIAAPADALKAGGDFAIGQDADGVAIFAERQSEKSPDGRMAVRVYRAISGTVHLDPSTVEQGAILSGTFSVRLFQNGAASGNFMGRAVVIGAERQEKP